MLCISSIVSSPQMEATLPLRAHKTILGHKFEMIFRSHQNKIFGLPLILICEAKGVPTCSMDGPVVVYPVSGVAHLYRR